MARAKRPLGSDSELNACVEVTGRAPVCKQPGLAILTLLRRNEVAYTSLVASDRRRILLRGGWHLDESAWLAVGKSTVSNGIPANACFLRPEWHGLCSFQSALDARR